MARRTTVRASSARPSAQDLKQEEAPPEGGASPRSRNYLRGLNLDFDVDAGREVEALKRVDRLRRVLDDVEQALVDPHLEVLAAVLVLVRRTDHREAMLFRG